MEREWIDVFEDRVKALREYEKERNRVMAVEHLTQMAFVALSKKGGEQASVTKEELLKAIEDYFAEADATKEDMKELLDLITGLVENHDWSVER